MQPAKIIMYALVVCSLMPPISSQTPKRSKRIVIAASVLLDGKGRALHGIRIVIEGTKIIALEKDTRTPDQWTLTFAA